MGTAASKVKAMRMSGSVQAAVLQVRNGMTLFFLSMWSSSRGQGEKTLKLERKMSEEA